ncbi:MAG: asparagine synthase (glutamine-hydrolyzing) [Candidatus Omnitrophica bacterium]|nr:asparagine synthase (glutamine-hydrolyzing) [Candidatus Omnitrophota bacterium]
MCGICGIIGESTSKEIRLMNSRLTHRGPDGEGYFEDNIVRLGHRRLKIIDLSRNGDQPMRNEDGSVLLVFNGEIYNFIELRNELMGRGHNFVSHADSEVIIHGYEEWGESIPEKLQGMFAFAIWDSRKRSLFLARDRLGVKPLHYYFDGKRFAFASQVSSLLCIHPKPEINRTALSYYLVTGYSPHPYDMVNGISKLPGGWSMVFKNQNISLRQYWKLQVEPVERDSIRESEVYEKVQDLIDKGVKRRLISDVPLGIFLSGGVDSSVILATALKYLPQPTKVFSIGYEEESFNELPYAKYIAEHFKAEYHPFVLKQHQFGTLMGEIVRFLDEPIADVSIIPTYYLAKMTRKFVTVALGGDGGDEFFSGYITHQNWKLIEIFSKLPVSTFSKFLSKGLNYLPENFEYLSWKYKLQGFLKGLEFPPQIRNYIWLGAFSPTQANALLSENLDSSSEKNRIEQLLGRLDSNNGNALSRMLFQDASYFLQDYLLVKVDLMSMANSLEVRGPFLDTELIDYVSRLPIRYKVFKGSPKKILRNLYRNRMPEGYFDRKKQGFSIPLGYWLHQKNVKDFFIEILSETNIKRSGLFNYRFVASLLHEHLKQKKNNWKQLWAVLTMQLWYNTHILNSGSYLENNA